MPKLKTYFQVIPVAVAKQIADADGADPEIVCVICDEVVALEHCKINEDGEAVHDHCYVSKLVDGNARIGSRKKKRA